MTKFDSIVICACTLCCLRVESTSRRWLQPCGCTLSLCKLHFSNSHLPARAVRNAIFFFFFKTDGLLVTPMSPLATACVEPTFVRCCWWPHNTSFMKVFVQNKAAPTICLHLIMLAQSQTGARVIVPHLSLTCCDHS